MRDENESVDVCRPTLGTVRSLQCCSHEQTKPNTNTNTRAHMHRRTVHTTSACTKCTLQMVCVIIHASHPNRMRPTNFLAVSARPKCLFASLANQFLISLHLWIMCACISHIYEYHTFFFKFPKFGVGNDDDLSVCPTSKHTHHLKRQSSKHAETERERERMFCISALAQLINMSALSIYLHERTYDCMRTNGFGIQKFH